MKEVTVASFLFPWIIFLAAVSEDPHEVLQLSPHGEELRPPNQQPYVWAISEADPSQ